MKTIITTAAVLAAIAMPAHAGNDDVVKTLTTGTGFGDIDHSVVSAR
jgi:hypothetical protein